MATNNRIRPGNVYEYRCDNDQGYGFMVPVKTSDGWDFVDTYQLDSPAWNHGETSDSASVRRVIDLGNGDHDGYVRRAASNFYHHNARYGAREVPHGLRLLLNLDDYDVVRRRECEDYDEATWSWTFRSTESSTSTGQAGEPVACASSGRAR